MAKNFGDIEISRLAKQLVTEAMPATDKELAGLKQCAAKIKAKYKDNEKL